MSIIFDFRQKTVLVTGATSGIGLATAEAFGQAGAHVIVHGRTDEECDKVVSTSVFEGMTVSPIATDLSHPDGSYALAEIVRAAASRVDVIVCNAGIAASGADNHEAAVTDVFAINLHHARIICAELIPEMAARDGGSIVLTSSLAALRGNGGLGVYSLTKAALCQLVRDLAVSWGPTGVRVNAVAPGLIATGWEERILSSESAKYKRLKMTPLRRIGQPNEVAQTTLFLASDAASFITGQTLSVDGGTSITDGS